MSLNLTIDQGNSAAKVALWDGDRLIDQIVEPTITCAHIKRFLSP
ncbi:pantothenate kinase, partial [Paramuribaculum intestinale]